MKSLYDTLCEMNRIEGAFSEWAAYRAALTAFILKNTSRGGSCLIVGAGACNDLDIGSLSSHFSRLTLLDYDTGSVRRAALLSEPGNITTLYADVLGVPADAYRALDAAMQAGMRAFTDGEELTSLFIDETLRLLRCAKPDPIPEADTVICCGVHSQLIAMFARMATVYAEYAPIGLERIYHTLSGVNRTLQPAFNDHLLASARETLILGLETGRAGMEGGIEGAAQALTDLSSRKLHGTQTNLLWPFDAAQNKLYSMQISAIQINRNRESHV